MPLTLVIPELLWPEPNDRDTFAALDCPALSALLARGQESHRPSQTPEAVLTELFGHAETPSYSAFRLLGEAVSTVDAGEHQWLNADPVHFRYHQEHMVLADSTRFALRHDEAQALADGLNGFFTELGQFHVVTPDRWYLQLRPGTPLDRLAAPPLSAVSGRRVDDLLPELMPELAMRNLFNEIQTYLHTHTVNRQRKETGQPPINGLWFWGAGPLPPRQENRFDNVWSNGPLASGLARAAGVTARPLPENAHAILSQITPDTRHLVVLDDLTPPVQYEDSHAYRAVLTKLEEHWFAPLRRALASGKVNELCIVAPTVYATATWTSRPRDRWKLWLRPQSLDTIAQQLASNTNESLRNAQP